jgi:hypothetical protein
VYHLIMMKRWIVFNSVAPSIRMTVIELNLEGLRWW